MSLPEPTPRSQAPIPPKPVPRPKPPVPNKPLDNGSECPPLAEKGTATKSSGKVKRIVNKFSQQEGVAGEGGVVEGVESHRVPKRAPTVKPKPPRIPQKAADQAPPLPVKRSRMLRKEAEQSKAEAPGGEAGPEAVAEAMPIRDEGRRSAPDGREVEVQVQVDGGAGTEAELTVGAAPSLRCERDCRCLCHQERPGMRLVWVPVGEDGEGEEEGEEGEAEEPEEEEVKEADQRGGEGQSEAGDQEEEDEEEEDYEEEEEEESGSSGEEGRLGGRAGRAKFQEVLDIMIGEGNRRRSSDHTVCAINATPQVVLTSYTPHLSQPPPSPSPSLSSRAVEEEEDSIYEATLEGVEVPPAKPSPSPSPTPQAKLIPIIRFQKPPRTARLSSSADTLPEPRPEPDPAGDQAIDDVPPAIPARVPIPACDKSKSPRLVTVPGGVPLPQPSPEEWRALRHSSPLPTPADSCLPPSPLLPHRAPPNPSSPLFPHRRPPPPPQPGPDGRRLSTHSIQSTIQSTLAPKDKEENTGSDVERVDTAEEEKPPAVPRRGMSIDLESQLQDEPLYQTYRATVIHKEIKRQTVCRNISKTSVDFHMDWSARRGGDTERGGVRGGPAQNTLWQDLPDVRNSGILDTLSSAECKYQESMFEVLTSEASYLRSLKVLTELFLESRDLDDTLIIHDKKTLFSNILKVREVSERFLKDLEERISDSVVISDICDIIHYHAQHHFPVYIDYVRNQIYQEKKYTNLMQKNPQFATVIARLQESPQCQRLPFMSFLLLPFQRITRIKMLIENILKRTQEGTKEEETASKALASVSKIIEECNTEVGKMKQMEELIHIAKSLEFDKLKALPIISQNRFLEKQGELQEMAKSGTLFNIRPKFTPIFLFLFNDLLVLASKKSAERYVVIDHTHRSLVQVKPLDEVSPGPGFDHCFCLVLLENHQGRMNERLLKASTQSEMHRWMAAFPDPNDPDRDAEEVVYEDWDCPQVQCAEQYVAQQADELSLEPTEIVNVIRKTNEGWYQGIRLSDGQKGWFPVSNVVEITNEHVRRRNLRERYRVIQAAGIVSAKSRTAP
ncbi:rho guanine nucleotide exchange factor 15 [Megalops cyprinoides]|uniref:rho guanine nucleotide exchange factor 15 n=1 Tax=Megalops cyprinoides TaxID=118141 RepID=UPI001864266B|nr:rho guanine nucleotide exchange factor 15 [Megalops cyprinoides]